MFSSAWYRYRYHQMTNDVKTMTSIAIPPQIEGKTPKKCFLSLHQTKKYIFPKLSHRLNTFENGWIARFGTNWNRQKTKIVKMSSRRASFRRLIAVIIIILIGGCFTVVNGGITCKRKPDGTILRHPLGCLLFIECLNGVTHTRYCPDGLLYSETKPPCDVAEKANCTDHIHSTRSSLATPSNTDRSSPLRPSRPSPTKPPNRPTSKTTAMTTVTTASARTQSTRRPRPTKVVTRLPSSLSPSSTSTTRRRRTRTTASTSATTMQTTERTTQESTLNATTPMLSTINSTELSPETATMASPTTAHKPINLLERGIKCPDNETADAITFVPSSVDCAK